MYALRLSRVLSLVAVVVSCSGCIGVERRIETQAGPQFVVSRAMDIVGVIRRTATSGNQRGGTGKASFDEYIGVPVGTDVIVPAVHGWTIGFGSLDPDDLSMVESTGELTMSIRPGHRPLGAAHVAVSVVDINAPSGAFGFSTTLGQVARIQHDFLLTDGNHDDSWFGIVSYHLICLSFAD